MNWLNTFKETLHQVLYERYYKLQIEFREIEYSPVVSRNRLLSCFIEKSNTDYVLSRNRIQTWWIEKSNTDLIIEKSNTDLFYRKSTLPWWVEKTRSSNFLFIRQLTPFRYNFSWSTWFIRYFKKYLDSNFSVFFIYSVNFKNIKEPREQIIWMHRRYKRRRFNRFQDKRLRSIHIYISWSQCGLRTTEEAELVSPWSHSKSQYIRRYL